MLLGRDVRTYKNVFNVKFCFKKNPKLKTPHVFEESIVGNMEHQRVKKSSQANGNSPLFCYYFNWNS